MGSSPTLVFRPSVKAYLRSTGIQLAIGVPILLLLTLAAGEKRLIAVAIGVALVGSVGAVFLYIAVARVFVTNDQIGWRGFARTRWFARDDVARTLLVKDLRDAQGMSRVEFFVFSRTSSLQLRLHGALWSVADLDALAAAIGAEHRQLVMPLPIAELGKMEQSALNWAERNPKALIAVSSGVVLAVAIPVTVALTR